MIQSILLAKLQKKNDVCKFHVIFSFGFQYSNFFSGTSLAANSVMHGILLPLSFALRSHYVRITDVIVRYISPVLLFLPLPEQRLTSL
jgi:hypothetical protein